MIHINNRDFVKAWMTSQTVDSVAKRLKITGAQASGRANTLRKKGVKLPAKHRPVLDDIDSLNAIIAKYTKK